MIGIHIFIGFWIIVLSMWILIDKLITHHRLSISQREWDEYSKGMTLEEKLDVFNDWLEQNKIKHGWNYFYIPRIWRNNDEDNN